MDVKHRFVTPNDWLFVLEIRNEDDVRNASFNTDLIKPNTHIEYMKRLEMMDDVYQRIITYDGNDVGYVKVIDNDVSYMIKKDFRGKGIMKNSFMIVFEDLKKLGKTKVKASIKADNYSSLKLVEKVGFVIRETVYKNNKPYSFVLEKYI